MKIYTARNKEAKSVELVQNFKMENKDKENLGFTHLHFRDCGSIGKNSKADVVFYVDLNEE